MTKFKDKLLNTKDIKVKLYIAFMSLVLCSCSNEYFEDSIFSNIVFYIVSDNNLHVYSDSLLLDLSKNVVSQNDSRIFVYVDDLNKPRLYQLQNGLILLNKYSEVNSLSPNHIHKVLTYLAFNYPANENGLIMWSHGTGWINVEESAESRAFGYDRGETVNLNKLFDALPIKYDYIVFDACNMGTIETLAEAKEKCIYLIGSPEPVPADGIINSLTINLLSNNSLSLEQRLKGVCDIFIENHQHYKEDISISLCKTSNIDMLIEHIKNKEHFFIEPSTIETIHTYEFRNQSLFFDAFSLFDTLQITDSNIKNFLLYNVSGYNNRSNGCGMSIFIPNIKNKSYFDSYRLLRWNKEVNWLDKW